MKLLLRFQELFISIIFVEHKIHMFRNGNLLLRSIVVVLSQASRDLRKYHLPWWHSRTGASVDEGGAL